MIFAYITFAVLLLSAIAFAYKKTQTIVKTKSYVYECRIVDQRGNSETIIVYINDKLPDSHTEKLTWIQDKTLSSAIPIDKNREADLNQNIYRKAMTLNSDEFLRLTQVRI